MIRDWEDSSFAKLKPESEVLGQELLKLARGMIARNSVTYASLSPCWARTMSRLRCSSGARESSSNRHRNLSRSVSELHAWRPMSGCPVVDRRRR